MSDPTYTIKVSVRWYQALGAVDGLTLMGEKDDFCLHDAEVLERAAKRIRDMFCEDKEPTR